MQNDNQQFETHQKRLTRFQNGSPIESISTPLNSIANFFNNEIVIASEREQTTLLFLGIHAVVLTISEVFWDIRGEKGYKKFLETFMDGDTDDLKFSLISNKIHNWRNILAHQWLASMGHKMQYNYTLKSGFMFDKNILIINPKKYFEQYKKAFSSSSKIWDYNKNFTDLELNNIKQRIIDKYLKT